MFSSHPPKCGTSPKAARRSATRSPAKSSPAPEPGWETPFHLAQSTAVAGLAKTMGGDNRFYNNLITGAGQIPSAAERGNRTSWAGSVATHCRAMTAASPRFLRPAKCISTSRNFSTQETHPLAWAELHPEIRLVEGNGPWGLELAVGGWDASGTERPGEYCTVGHGARCRFALRKPRELVAPDQRRLFRPAAPFETPCARPGSSARAVATSPARGVSRTETYCAIAN
jgi:hypothetical protein